MNNSQPFRTLVAFAIGGGWGIDHPQEGYDRVTVIRGTDFDRLRRSQFDDIPVRYEQDKKLRTRRLQPSDIVLEVSGGSPSSGQTTGRTSFIDETVLSQLACPAIPASFCRLVRIDSQRADPRYAFYALQDMYLSGRASGYEQQSTGISNFQFEYFLDNEYVRVPALSEQRAIAHILGTLDDKIDLNRQMSATLEAMARALFESWFVRFDPVRAKAEGRDTGLPAEIADLFPDRFEESETGELPKGWKVVRLADVLRVAIGGTWGQDTPTSPDDVAVSCLRGIDCADLAGGAFPTPPQRWVKANAVDGRVPQTGDILVEGSGSFCGRSLWWDSRYITLIHSTVVYSNFCKRLTSDAPRISRWAWEHMRRWYSNGDIGQFRTGTAFPNLDVRGMLSGLVAPMAPEPLLQSFLDFSQASARVDLLAQQRTLAQLRDTLLPKLISGDLRVPDAERVLADAGV